MTNFIQNLSSTTNQSTTTNGAITNSTSKNRLLDFFFSIGNARTYATCHRQNLIDIFEASLAEDEVNTLKSLFYMRDIRGGQGERLAFRICLKFYIETRLYPSIDTSLYTKREKTKSFNVLFDITKEYGRQDDYIQVIQDIIREKKFSREKKGVDKKLNLFINIAVSPIVNIIFNYYSITAKNNGVNLQNYKYIGKKLASNVLKRIPVKLVHEKDKLLFKWIPRQDYITRVIVNKLSNQIARHFGIKPISAKNTLKRYHRNLLIDRTSFRKFIVKHSDTVEQKLTAKKYSLINFEKISSLSIKRHWTHFNNVMKPQIEKYIQDLKEGKAKININTLYPYDVVRTLADNEDLANSQWKTIIENIDKSGIKLNVLPMIDASGSMYSGGTSGLGKHIEPIHIATSLGLIVAECNQNASYKNKVITFSENPVLIDLNRVEKFSDKVKLITKQNHLNTDFYEAMQVIIESCKDSKEDTPDAIVCFSDMEFDDHSTGRLDSSSRKTLINSIKDLAISNGVKLPKIIFWNISKETDMNYPTLECDENVIMLGGYSHSLLKNILSDNLLEYSNPSNFMYSVLNSERYSKVNSFVPFYKQKRNAKSKLQKR